MIRVLVVDDSEVARRFLTHILSADTDIEVIDTARDGEEAAEKVARLRPDVVTMDVRMPKMDGYAATRLIMESNPVPVIIVTASFEPAAVERTFHAFDAGAVAVLAKPPAIGHPDHDRVSRELVRTVKLMSEVKVVRRRASLRRPAEGPVDLTVTTFPTVRIVAIGASTGGPPALQTVLSALPADFPVPILVVQHISAGFTQGFVEWLGESAKIPVKIAEDGELLLPGCCYVAPDGTHLEAAPQRRARLSGAPAEHGLRPAVSVLFRSVTARYGSDAVGVLLTGMGKDGADELKGMRDVGAATIAQDAATSVVHGMPGEAIRLGAAKHVLAIDRIAPMLERLAEGRG